MSGAADQKQIGRTILNNMGFEKTTSEQQEAMGAIAMDIVFKTFDKNQTKKDQLFRKEEVPTVKEGWSILGMFQITPDVIEYVKLEAGSVVKMDELFKWASMIIEFYFGGQLAKGR